MHAALLALLILQQPQNIKPPKLKKFVEAVYPEAKKQAGVEAQVLLGIEIDETGAVTGVEVVKSAGSEDFDAAALAAAKQFVFEPAEVDGTPAPVKIDYRYEFKIETKMVSTGPQVNFEGVVLERFKKTPLRGVKVSIKDLDVSTDTDDDGAFAFTDVPVGPHKVSIEGKNLISVDTEETVIKGKKKTLKYFVEQKEAGVDEEVVVRATRIKKESVETTIRTEEARRVPGTQGDTLKVVQNLPGVGRSAFGSGQLIVWGSSPKETRVVVDGVEVPTLYHVGGLRSTINSDMTRSIDLAPGAYGSEYGRGLGGLVRVETQPLPQSGVHGYVAADVMDVSGMLSVAPTPWLQLAGAGRRSYLDSTLKAVSSQDVGDFVPIPVYDDYQFRANAQIRKDEKLSLLFLAADDTLHRSIPNDDPAEVRTEATDSSFKRLILRYQRLLADGASFYVTPSFGLDDSKIKQTFGPVPTEVDTNSWRVAMRAAYRRKLAKFATMTVGADAEGAHSEVTRIGSISLPAREGDITVFGQPPGDEINADDWKTNIASAATFAFVELALPKMSITPGIRFEPYFVDGSRLTPIVGNTPSIGYTRINFAFDPRIQITLKPSKKLTVNAAAGIYHQPPDPEDLSAVFGNPTLGLEEAEHFSGGFNYKLTGTLTFEAVGFYKLLHDLVSRNESPTPPLAQALTQDGIGRVYGGQVLLRQELWHGFFGWVTYSAIRSERKDHPDQSYRLFDFDQTHVLGVLASYAFGHGWEAGARFRYTTGFPRTPVTGAFYDVRDDVYQPTFGAHNSIRIPPFYQLDMRLEKQISFQRYKLSLFVDVQNVTNRRNPEEFIYNFDFTRRDTIAGLPTLAVLGARLDF
jgi:TonB family protein